MGRARHHATAGQSRESSRSRDGHGSCGSHKLEASGYVYRCTTVTSDREIVVNRIRPADGERHGDHAQVVALTIRGGPGALQLVCTRGHCRDGHKSKDDPQGNRSGAFLKHIDLSPQPSRFDPTTTTSE